jgi:transaldolase
MTKDYFHRVNELSPTKFWINNPSREEAHWAIQAGALGCTCNPSYGQKMLDHPSDEESKYAYKLLDETLHETQDDCEAVALFQAKLVKAIAEIFLPMYEQSGGMDGWVTIQGDPVREHDPNVILNEAYKHRKLADNISIKIPTTVSGLKAMTDLVAADVPITATEIFGLSQAKDVCETYLRISKGSNRRPRMHLAHIAGIYDDYLKNYVEENEVDLYPDLLAQAGLSIARRVYSMIIENNYPVTLVGGGARGLHHFTEMVGGECVVTINWRGTADQLLKEDPPVVWHLFNPVPENVIEELTVKLPDYKRGYLYDGLEKEEYADFGPVVLFRSGFVKSWNRILDIIKARRPVKA